MREFTPQTGMHVRTGIDLVVIAEFEESLTRGGDSFRRRLFHPSEESGADTQRLAAVFAAKEAAFKALSLPPGDWHVLEIRHEPDGRPYVALSTEYDSSHILSLDLSITHSGGYVVASVVALVNEQATSSR